MQLNTGHYYQFGPYRLNPAERQLVRDDQPVSLAPKTFELLVYLVANHGRLVTKDQIFEAVWPGSFVEDSNLTVSISALRRALAEKESGQQYIETVTKAGYRFVAPVSEGESSSEVVVQDRTEANEAALLTTTSVESDVGESREVASGRSATRLRLLMAVVVVVAIVGIVLSLRLGRKSPEVASSERAHSLAVLPFRNLTHDPDSDFLGFSLADAVITKLGYVGALTGATVVDG